MIVPMKKYTLLVYHKEYARFLDQLQEYGVVHVIERNADVNSSQLNGLIHSISNAEKVLRLLAKYGTVKIEKESDLSQTPAAEIVEQTLKYQSEIEPLQHKLTGLQKEHFIAEPWGDFSQELIDELLKYHVEVFLFTCQESKFNPEWKEKYALEIINQKNDTLYIAYFVRKNGDVFDLPLEPHVFPNRGLKSIEADIAETKKNIDAARAYFESAAFEIERIRTYKNHLQSQLDYEKVKLNTQHEASEKLRVLEGWVPVDAVDTINAKLDTSGVVYFTSEAEPYDKVPILLKNSRFAKLFEPVGKLFSLPSYIELDLTALFAPFFMLFFGFCLGDAGYGVLLLVIASLYKLKAKPDIKPILSLVQWLGAATILMGMISGTLFGVNLLDTGYTLTAASFDMLKSSHIPMDIVDKLQALLNQHFDTRDAFSKALKTTMGSTAFEDYKSQLYRYAFSDYKILDTFRHFMLDSNQMFRLSLGIGLVQIVFGMCVKAANFIRQRGLKYALATLGWVFVIIGMLALLALKFMGIITKETFTVLTYVVLGISGFFILVFNDPDANPFVSVGKGLYDVYGMVTGVFGDLLSYIRLFALGTSGAILGFVINTVALQFKSVPYAGWLLFVIFLIIGHALVIGLSVLGAFVHPMRLTFVEFYKNAGFAGGGKEYKPFKK